MNPVFIQKLEEFFGMAPGELVLYVSILSLLSLILLILIRSARASNETRRLLARIQDKRHNLDRDNIVIVTAILDPVTDGVEFMAETHPGAPLIGTVFTSDHIAAEARRRSLHCTPGRPLFVLGTDDHYKAMEQAYRFLSGPVPSATEAAATGHHDEQRISSQKMLLTVMEGEDGINTPHILKGDAEVIRRLATLGDHGLFRATHRAYAEVFASMHDVIASSARLFEAAKSTGSVEAVKEAGRNAAVWTVPIRTSKLLTEADVRRIIREELATALSRSRSAA